jgi:hypothetical protein
LNGEKANNLVSYDDGFFQRVCCTNSAPSHSRSRLMGK